MSLRVGDVNTAAELASVTAAAGCPAQPGPKHDPKFTVAVAWRQSALEPPVSGTTLFEEIEDGLSEVDLCCLCPVRADKRVLEIGRIGSRVIRTPAARMSCL